MSGHILDKPTFQCVSVPTPIAGPHRHSPSLEQGRPHERSCCYSAWLWPSLHTVGRSSSQRSIGWIKHARNSRIYAGKEKTAFPFQGSKEYLETFAEDQVGPFLFPQVQKALCMCFAIRSGSLLSNAGHHSPRMNLTCGDSEPSDIGSGRLKVVFLMILRQVRLSDPGV